LLFAIVFFWTPPHFWSLALYAEIDYQRAGVPMLPVTAGARQTRWHIFIYTVVLVAVSLLPALLGVSGRVYGAAAAVLGLGYLAASWRVLRDRQDALGHSLTRDAPARAAFRFSLVYLALLFGAVAIDAAIR
jgi:protoheme IX farnesyltransferase